MACRKHARKKEHPKFLLHPLESECLLHIRCFKGLSKQTALLVQTAERKKGMVENRQGLKHQHHSTHAFPEHRGCQCLKTEALYCFTALELKPNPAVLDLPVFDINQGRDGFWASERRLRAASVPLEQEGDGITAGTARRVTGTL